MSEEDNSGARQLYQALVPPRRQGAPLHHNVAFVETFSVIEGMLGMYLDRERRHVLLKPGESVAVPIG